MIMFRVRHRPQSSPASPCLSVTPHTSPDASPAHPSSPTHRWAYEAGWKSSAEGVRGVRNQEGASPDEKVPDDTSTTAVVTTRKWSRLVARCLNHTQHLPLSLVIMEQSNPMTFSRRKIDQRYAKLLIYEAVLRCLSLSAYYGCFSSFKPEISECPFVLYCVCVILFFSVR